MSGQPYKYISDIQKYRTEYMESLGLRADLDALNLDANKTYKETGQLPAVSQMKDTRTTTEILADSEKLKNDLVKSIATISSTQFAQQVVQEIINNPLNSDNKLLVFTAQRIDDVIANLKKLYKYGIKGDKNDVEQFVNFVATMYNDKNAIVAQTKSFMDRQGIKSLNNTGPFTALFENLVKIGATVINYRDELDGYIDELDGEELYDLKELIHDEMGNIVDYITFMKQLIPTNPLEISRMEDFLVTFEANHYPADVETMSNYSNTSRTEGVPSEHSYIAPSIYGFSEYEKYEQTVKDYLDFLNLGLPNSSTLMSILKQLILFFGEFQKSLNNIDSILIKDGNMLGSMEQALEKMINSPIYNASLISGNKYLETVLNLKEALNPHGYWVIRNMKKLKSDVDELYNAMGHQINTAKQLNPDINVHVSNLPQIQDVQSVGPSTQTTHGRMVNGRVIPEEIFVHLMDEMSTLSDLDARADSEGLSEDERSQLIHVINDVVTSLGEPSLQVSDSDDFDHIVERGREIVQFLRDNSNAPSSGSSTSGSSYESTSGTSSSGHGIKKRRGRPSGSGIAKPISYKESVKAHSVLDKGIMETPRFVKFGKYLVNNHKLNNENIFALKRMSGGNIVEIPSIKISNNLSNVIKKMVGGSIPTYSDISKLSEPEKAYLHKISQKSNILDKFDIPAPSKDQKEKDIHDFEVMKGEIMAGNDSKELIKKFKLHIMKLSKNGTLPKREVSEIMEELIQLGF